MVPVSAPVSSIEKLVVGVEFWTWKIVPADAALARTVTVPLDPTAPEPDFAPPVPGVKRKLPPAPPLAFVPPAPEPPLPAVWVSPSPLPPVVALPVVAPPFAPETRIALAQEVPAPAEEAGAVPV